MFCFEFHIFKKNAMNEIDNKFFEIIPVNITNTKIDSPNPNKEANENYEFALNFLKRIVDNLEETSSLVNRLNQINSPISTNITSMKKEFELSYISLNELKEHLYTLLNTKIVRYFSREEENGISHDLSGIVGINEFKLFDMTTFDNSPHFSYPHSRRLVIVKVLLHELFGHCKVRYFTNRQQSSINYYENGISCSYSETNGIISTGMLLEKCISSMNAIDSLNKCDEIKAQKLLFVNLWTGKNYNELHEILGIDPDQIKKDFPFDCQSNTTKITNFSHYDEDEFCHACT